MHVDLKNCITLEFSVRYNGKNESWDICKMCYEGEGEEGAGGQTQILIRIRFAIRLEYVKLKFGWLCTPPSSSFLGAVAFCHQLRPFRPKLYKGMQNLFYWFVTRAIKDINYMYFLVVCQLSDSIIIKSVLRTAYPLSPT